MKNKGVNEKLKYFIPLLVFILIFSFVLACGVEPPREVEWKRGEPIDFPNGLRLTLNKVWKEKQYGKTFIVINVTLENTTNETQEDGIVFSMSGSIFYVYDSEDNKFLSDGCLEGNTIFDKIDSLSPGINKKWKPGVKLTGNICCDIHEESKDLNIKLEYSGFLRTNVIYCYKLEDIEE